MNVCFWNIHKNKEKQKEDFNVFLKNLLIKKDIDLFCICEYEKFNNTVLLDNNYELVDKAYSSKVICYKKKGCDFTQIRLDKDERFVIIKCIEKNLLFVCVHSYDLRNNADDKRILLMKDIRSFIEEYKTEETRVFIFGDFNCMPYDLSIVSRETFNCVLYKGLININRGEERYYNPMLLYLSEIGENYGSFYKDEQINYLKWFLLDQVIVNKKADEIMDYKSLQIIKSIDSINLLKNNKPNASIYSDHLPLFFKIKEEKNELHKLA